MIIYATQGDAYNWHRETTFFHTVMFHGEARLPRGKRGVASHNIGESPMTPMKLTVNGFYLSDIFIPIRSTNLVVSERVKAVIEPFQPRFTFLPVVFEKVYNLPWSLGESLHPLSPFYTYCQQGRELSILREAYHAPMLARQLPPYYEVVTYNHYPLLKLFPPTDRFLTRNDEGEPFDDEFLPVSRALFEEYPITCPGFPVIRGDLYNAIQPYLNPLFFGVTSYSLR